MGNCARPAPGREGKRRRIGHGSGQESSAFFPVRFRKNPRRQPHQRAHAAAARVRAVKLACSFESSHGAKAGQTWAEVKSWGSGGLVAVCLWGSWPQNLGKITLRASGERVPTPREASRLRVTPDDTCGMFGHPRPSGGFAGRLADNSRKSSRMSGHPCTSRGFAGSLADNSRKPPQWW